MVLLKLKHKSTSALELGPKEIFTRSASSILLIRLSGNVLFGIYPKILLGLQSRERGKKVYRCTEN